MISIFIVVSNSLVACWGVLHFIVLLLGWCITSGVLMGNFSIFTPELDLWVSPDRTRINRIMMMRWWLLDAGGRFWMFEDCNPDKNGRNNLMNGRISCHHQTWSLLTSCWHQLRIFWWRIYFLKWSESKVMSQFSSKNYVNQTTEHTILFVLCNNKHI